MSAVFDIIRLGSDEIASMRELLGVFGESFDLSAEYAKSPPSDDYLAEQLSNPSTIVLCAAAEAGADATKVVGGLVAFLLPKFDSARSELYLYDLAVAEPWRRRGIATGLIQALSEIAELHGGADIFVQTDYEYHEAIALYTKLGARSDVIHFDIGPFA